MWQLTDGHEHGERATGSLAEELRLLLDALADRAAPWLERMAGERVDGGCDGAGELPTTCQWCPLCAAVAAMRGERPELAAGAADHLAGVVAMVRRALADDGAVAAERGSAGIDDRWRGRRESSKRAQPPERVQRIEVTRRGDEHGRDADDRS